MTCTGCGGPIRSDNKRGYCKQTPECRAANQRSWYEDNKSRLSRNQADWYVENRERILTRQATWRAANKDRVRNNSRWANYRIRPEQYDAMLAEQDGKCAGCGRDDVPLMLDHNHACCDKLPTCGQCNRGLLCDRCNRSIGFVFENPDTLRALAKYLERE